MAKVEYPKMIYKGEGLTDHIVVKNIEDHLIKQREGYHQHDGTLIEDIKFPVTGVPELDKIVKDVDKEEAAAENTPGPEPETGKIKISKNAKLRMKRKGY